MWIKSLRPSSSGGEKRTRVLLRLNEAASVKRSQPESQPRSWPRSPHPTGGHGSASAGFRQDFVSAIGAQAGSSLPASGVRPQRPCGAGAAALAGSPVSSEPLQLLCVAVGLAGPVVTFARGLQSDHCPVADSGPGRTEAEATAGPLGHGRPPGCTSRPRLAAMPLGHPAWPPGGEGGVRAWAPAWLPGTAVAL